MTQKKKKIIQSKIPWYFHLFTMWGRDVSSNMCLRISTRYLGKRVSCVGFEGWTIALSSVPEKFKVGFVSCSKQSVEIFYFILFYYISFFLWFFFFFFWWDGFFLNDTLVGFFFFFLWYWYDINRNNFCHNYFIFKIIINCLSFLYKLTIFYLWFIIWHINR